MRVVYVGSFDKPWSTETYVARELEALGHTVVRCEAGRTLLARVELEAVSSELLLMQGSQLPAIAAGMFKRVEHFGCVTAGYHLDVFRGLARASRVDTESFWRMRHVFTADGSPETQEWMEQHDVNHHWLPAGCVTDECVEGFIEPDLRCDVIFVGSQHYHAEWPWRAELLEALRARYGKRFRVYSDNSMRGRQLNNLYRSAKVVVGDSMFAGSRSKYWSDRYYETAGRGGFLLAPYVEGIEQHFDDGVHLAFYRAGDLDDVFAKIDFHLQHEAHARDIAVHGQSHVLKHHTYRHRVSELLDVCGLS